MLCPGLSMQTMVPVRLPMSYCRCNCGLTSRGGRVEREVYVSGRGLFHSLVRVDSSTAAALYGWTRRGLFHSLIRRVDYRLKTTVGHAVVAARSRTGADCCNLYRSLATRTPGRGTGERTRRVNERTLAATAALYGWTLPQPSPLCERSHFTML